jgi:hypothetical protein
VYVVREEEIGFPLLIEIDTILALKGALFVKGNEQINPLFGTPNELDPRPVLATGLLASFVSLEWAIESEAFATQVEQRQYHDPLTNTKLPIYGMVDV